MGAKGALLATSNEILTAEAVPVAVVSTVGAGDSLMGGMIYGLDRGDSLADAFTLGIAAATATLKVPGTQLCSREDTDRFADSVSIKSLAAAHEVEGDGPVLGSEAPRQSESVACGASDANAER
jgi:6-phosphofructokinase 2